MKMIENGAAHRKGFSLPCAAAVRGDTALGGHSVCRARPVLPWPPLPASTQECRQRQTVTANMTDMFPHNTVSPLFSFPFGLGPDIVFSHCLIDHDLKVPLLSKWNLPRIFRVHPERADSRLCCDVRHSETQCETQGLWCQEISNPVLHLPFD